MKFSEVVLLSTFLRSSMRRWKDAKNDLSLDWQTRCLDCQIPLFGTNTRCLTCYSLWRDELQAQENEQEWCQEEPDPPRPTEKFFTAMVNGVPVKHCSACGEPAEKCLCDGEDVYIGCRICGHNCYGGDYPDWRFCSRYCMTYESRRDRYW